MQLLLSEKQLCECLGVDYKVEDLQWILIQPSSIFFSSNRKIYFIIIYKIIIDVKIQNRNQLFICNEIFLTTLYLEKVTVYLYGLLICNNVETIKLRK